MSVIGNKDLKQNVLLLKIQEVKKKRLTYLDLSCMGLSELPDDISELDTIIELDLSYNEFFNFPKPLSKLYNLDKLILANNYLDDVYFDIGKYYSIRYLDLANNCIDHIPKHILYLKELEEVSLDENPFYSHVPEEVINGGIWAVQNYNEAVRESRSVHRLFETKLLLVGDGEVGKTTIRKVLGNPKLTVEMGKEPTTHGIDIQTWFVDVLFPLIGKYYNPILDSENTVITDLGASDEQNSDVFLDEYYDDYIDYRGSLDVSTNYPVPISDEDSYVRHEVKINIWDFGGQDIYHTTHQFFLTKRSIYLMVWEPRKDTEEDSFEYWLHTIKFFSASSPVIMVMNKLDERLKHIDENALKRDYPNIESFHKISCVTKEGLENLRASIIEAVKLLPHLGERLPAVWIDINNHLKKLEQDFIELDEYYIICGEFGLDPSRADFLSDYLHDLGKVLHFKKDSILQNTLILNPDWATRAVYHLIDNIDIQKNGGKFILNDLKTIWAKENYPFNKHLELVRLLERFELCFNLIGTDNYILPGLLYVKKPYEQINEIENSIDKLHFMYEYRFMVSGIVSRLICNLHFLIYNDCYWKNGVIFQNEDSRALIQESKSERSISIKIIGGVARSGLLAIIRHEMKRIHQSLNLLAQDANSIIEKVQCVCSECQKNKTPYLFDYKVLSTFLSKGKKNIDCQKSAESVLISDILEGMQSNTYEIELHKYMLVAATELQGRHMALHSDEDSRNSFISSILSAKGVLTKDQARWGKSEVGKKAGELDIRIVESSGMSVSIFEGINLSYINRDQIKRHVEKIHKYDANGLKNNYICVYAESKDYLGFCKRYFDLLDEFKSDKDSITMIDDLSDELSQVAEIKVFRSSSHRQDFKTHLYHLIINLYQG